MDWRDLRLKDIKKKIDEAGKPSATYTIDDTDHFNRRLLIAKLNEASRKLGSAETFT